MARRRFKVAPSENIISHKYTPSVDTVIVLPLVDVPHYTTRVRGYMVGSEMG